MTKRKHEHNLIGQWCEKCRKYIGKIEKEEKQKPYIC